MSICIIGRLISPSGSLGFTFSLALSLLGLDIINDPYPEPGVLGWESTANSEGGLLGVMATGEQLLLLARDPRGLRALARATVLCSN